MELSGSQKFLKVVSIIDIVGAIASLLFGVLLLTGSGMIGGMKVATLADQGLNAETQSLGVAAFGLAAAIVIIIGIIELIEGILGIRAANDASKIMPVWILAIISLTFSAINLFMGLTNMAGVTFNFSQVITLGFDVLMFWIANNIRNQNTEE